MLVGNPTDDPFLTRWNAFYSTTNDVAITLGLRPLSGSSSRVQLRMPLNQSISQPAGMFSAAALFGLADISATFLALQHVESGQFPLAVQASINLVGNTDRGDAVSSSTLIKTGRTLIVTNTEVHDERERLLCSVVGTFFVR
jgi:uncharacterized protein (TIGR00369 family)